MAILLKLQTCILALSAISFVLITSSGMTVCSTSRRYELETGSNNGNNQVKRKARDLQEDGGKPEYYLAGSSLPDCTHACGACFPCKRVMVSFKCSASESCPVVYRCMCKGKFYPVPSAH